LEKGQSRIKESRRKEGCDQPRKHDPPPPQGKRKARFQRARDPLPVIFGGKESERLVRRLGKEASSFEGKKGHLRSRPSKTVEEVKEGKTVLLERKDNRTSSPQKTASVAEYPRVCRGKDKRSEFLGPPIPREEISAACYALKATRVLHFLFEKKEEKGTLRRTFMTRWGHANTRRREKKESSSF